MKVTLERLQDIFERTDGNCHICHRKMYFKNYAQFGQRGAWEIEHSIPRCNGGTDCLNNLYAAHIRCNRQKGAKATRTARSVHGHTKAPLSANKKEKIRSERALALGTLAALAGAATGGLGAALIWGGAGAALGRSLNPEK